MKGEKGGRGKTGRRGRDWGGERDGRGREAADCVHDYQHHGADLLTSKLLHVFEHSPCPTHSSLSHCPGGWNVRWCTASSTAAGLSWQRSLLRTRGCALTYFRGLSQQWMRAGQVRVGAGGGGGEEK